MFALPLRPPLWPLLLALGCHEPVSGAGSGQGAAPTLPAGSDRMSDCSAVNPGTSPIRRLTRLEYNNTVRDLLGDKLAPASSFAPEETAGGFNNNAQLLGVTSLLAEQYKSAAEKLAQAATANLASLLPCDPAADGEPACSEAFIQHFGERAFRRPLSAEELQRFKGGYAWGRANGDFRAGIQVVLEAMLQSPNFLYRPEFGGAALQQAPDVVRLTSWEMASRLSYFLWGSMPDATLLDLARADQLNTPEQIQGQVKRLLTDPRAVARIEDFHTQWLDLDRVASLERDPQVYAGYSATIPQALARETLSFVNEVLWKGDRSLRTLLTAPYTYMNADLARFYGVSGPTGDAFEKVPLDASIYSGLLTQGGLLASHSSALSTSPVQRGKFVREQFLCQALPPPPADIVIRPPDLNPNLTTRERFAQHSADARCASCHHLLDPVGLGFESFDAVGRYRSVENGKPIDASGELVNADVAGRFNGAAGLASLLAQSQDVAACMVTQWARYAYGRIETETDACMLQKLRTSFAASNLDILDLVVRLTETDAFLYRKVVTP